METPTLRSSCWPCYRDRFEVVNPNEPGVKHPIVGQWTQQYFSVLGESALGLVPIIAVDASRLGHSRDGRPTVGDIGASGPAVTTLTDDRLVGPPRQREPSVLIVFLFHNNYKNLI